jgi:non-heme Fe2+,alpha-ketoglutarate-dependent halogenase
MAAEYGAPEQEVKPLTGPQRRRAIVRNFVKNRIAAAVVFTAFIFKPFPFLHRFLPTRIRGIVHYWTWRMQWIFVSSGGNRVLADLPSTPRIPANFKPKSEVEPKWKMSEEQVKFFYDRGYISPLKLFEPEEMAERLREVEAETFQPGETGMAWKRNPKLVENKVYGGNGGRDRHLDVPSVFGLAMQQGIYDRVAQLLGPDLLLWRTQLLPKPPGAPETAWHQVSTFTLSGFALRPVIEPEDINDLYNVTAWLALEDVDIENGCMQFWRGSHRKPIHQMHIGGGGQAFAKAAFRLMADIPPSELDDIVLKAGEFIIFHERTVHGAPMNSSKTRRRFGMNYRICRPDVYVYRGMKIQISNTFDEVYPLDHWTTILARGEDKFKRNKVALPAEIEARHRTIVRTPRREAVGV